MTTPVLLMEVLTVVPAAAILRDPIASSWDSSEPSFGLPQALLLISIIALVLLLIGVVVWRARRGSRSRPK